MACSACAISAGPPIDKQADIAWVAEGEFCDPETVLPLPDQTLLVSNVCDFRTTGDGFLSLLGPDGDVLDWRAVTGLDSPLGMAFADKRLYVVDNNAIKVFDWPTYKLLHTINLKTRVANDVAIAKDGSLYVSDTGAHQVVKISVSGEQSLVDHPFEFKNANGIAVFENTLFVGGERLWRINLSDGTRSVLGPDWLTDIDGIEFEEDGRMQITPVGGALIRYNEHGRSERLSGPGISSANHGYSTELGLALIPTGYDNTVIAIRVKPRGTSRP
ncbi:MAG: hypothetical protein AAF385_00810 [Pseudomonadota bacterium]